MGNCLGRRAPPREEQGAFARVWASSSLRCCRMFLCCITQEPEIGIAPCAAPDPIPVPLAVVQLEELPVVFDVPPVVVEVPQVVVEVPPVVVEVPPVVVDVPLVVVDVAPVVVDVASVDVPPVVEDEDHDVPQKEAKVPTDSPIVGPKGDGPKGKEGRKGSSDSFPASDSEMVRRSTKDKKRHGGWQSSNN